MRCCHTFKIERDRSSYRRACAIYRARAVALAAAVRVGGAKSLLGWV